MSKWLLVKRCLREEGSSHSRVCCSVSRLLSFVTSTHVSLFHLFVRVSRVQSLFRTTCSLFRASKSATVWILMGSV